MAANQKMENSNAGEMSGRLVFLKNLQTVTNKIHATSNIDEIMLEMSQDICDLFNCDRLTIYVLSEDKQSVVSKVKTGLNSFKDLKLPISEQSVAGYVAETRKAVNIRDVYDDVELTSYSPRMQFLKEVDKRTGYRSKQMLVAPILDAQNGALLGVVQLINSRSDAPFSAVAVEGVQSLAQTLAIAFTQRQKPRQSVRSKYDGLVADAVISADELDLAQRSARRKGVDLEDVLMKEFQVKLPAIGASLSKFFSVPYEPFKGDRIKPMDLLKNLKRDYVEANHWLPIEETPEGVVVISMDPERIKSSRVVNNIFPKAGSSIASRPIGSLRRRLTSISAPCRISLRWAICCPIWVTRRRATRAAPVPMTWQLPQTTNWFVWSTRSSSKLISRAPRTSISSPGRVRKRH